MTDPVNVYGQRTSCRAGWPEIVVILPLTRSLSSSPKALASWLALQAVMPAGTSGVRRYFPFRCRRAAAGTPAAIHVHIRDDGLIHIVLPIWSSADVPCPGIRMVSVHPLVPTVRSRKAACPSCPVDPVIWTDDTAARSAIALRAIWSAVSPASGSSDCAALAAAA